MGLTDSRDVLASLWNRYKSLRKYCDPVYGEVTVVQDKQTLQYYALIEKTLARGNADLPTVPLSSQELKRHNPHIIPLHQHTTCPLSVCSNLTLHFFLFPYAAHTLEMEVLARQEEDLAFTEEQALSLLAQQTEIATYFSLTRNPQTGRNYRVVLSNNSFLCSSTLNLTTIEPIFKCESQSFDETPTAYLSPEAYRMLKCGESHRVRQVACRQGSVVFTLAINWLECLLLADISPIYPQNSPNLQMQQLSMAIEQVRGQYGHDIADLLTLMTMLNENERPTLETVKRHIRRLRHPRKQQHRNPSLPQAQLSPQGQPTEDYPIPSHKRTPTQLSTQ